MITLHQKGFSLLEILIAVAIIGILASVVITSISGATESARVSKAGFHQRQMTKATELYYADMGFYPPDVNRGWDPGFEESLPWNPDEGTAEPPSGSYVNPGTNCNHCPSDWEDIVAAQWNGPYMTWPQFTPWDGKYDYNYWGSGANRSGCSVPPGIYAGVQPNYAGENGIPLKAEEKMVVEGFDHEACLNSESQMLLREL